MFSVETERLDEWPRNGTLGLLGICRRSIAIDELRRDAWSKWPDRFSRRDACKANPESFRDTGVEGRGGNLTEVGDTVLSDEGLLVLDVELVFGRSWPFDGGVTGLAFKKAL